MYTHIFTISSFRLFFLLIKDFIWYHFAWVWKISFSISCTYSTVLLAVNNFKFNFSEMSLFYPHFFKNFYLFIYLWLCWVFVSVRGLSLVAASGGHSSSRCTGLSLSRPLLLRSTGSRRAGSVVVAHGLSCSTACGIFPDQGSNPCPLHWQADSQPLSHQGSLILIFLNCIFMNIEYWIDWFVCWFLPAL